MFDLINEHYITSTIGVILLIIGMVITTIAMWTHEQIKKSELIMYIPLPLIVGVLLYIVVPVYIVEDIQSGQQVDGNSGATNDINNDAPELPAGAEWGPGAGQPDYSDSSQYHGVDTNGDGLSDYLRSNPDSFDSNNIGY